MAAIDRYIEKELKADLKEVSNRYPNFCPKCACNIPTHCEYCGLLPIGNGCFVPTGYKDIDQMIVYASRRKEQGAIPSFKLEDIVSSE